MRFLNRDPKLPFLPSMFIVLVISLQWWKETLESKQDQDTVWVNLTETSNGFQSNSFQITLKRVLYFNVNLNKYKDGLERGLRG